MGADEHPGQRGHKRLGITLCVFLYVLLGVPIWWHLTSINRPKLPHTMMQQASEKLSNTSRILPTSIVLYLVGEEGMFPDDPTLAESVYLTMAEHAGLQDRQQMEDLLRLTVVREAPSCPPLPPPLINPPSCWPRYFTPPPSPPCLDIFPLLVGLQQQQQDLASTPSRPTPPATDAQLDELLDTLIQRAGWAYGGHYFLFVLPSHFAAPAAAGPGGLQPPHPPPSAPEPEPHTGAGPMYQMTFGRHRHAWLWYPGGGTAPGPAQGAAPSGGRAPEGERSQSSGVGTSHQQARQQARQRVYEVLEHVAAPAVGRSFARQPDPDALGLPISPAGQTILSFWLVNAEPEPMTGGSDAQGGAATGRGFATWDFKAFEAAYLQPILSALAPVVELSVVSQVRLHAPARTHGTWSARNGAYVVEPAQLPFFVDSDWSLDFGVPAVPIYDAQGASDVTLCCWPPYACIELGGEDGRGRQGSWGSQASHVPAHTLHMVLYVPPASRRPMLLLQRAGGGAALTSSFWVPHWGGVHLLQREGEAGGAGEELPGAGGVDKGDGDGQGAAQQRPPGAMGRGLDARAMHDFAESTTAQLRVLFGLGAGPEEALQVPSGGGTGSGHSSRGSRVAGLPAVRVLPASVAGFAQWEVDLVLRRRVARDIAAAARVLGSLSRTVLALPNLAMPDVIGQQVQGALGSLHQAGLAADISDYETAGREARAAHAAAEAAFSHPAILAQLSFPDSHKLGVYMPLFFPALLTIGLAFLREVQHHIRRSWKASKQGG